MQWNNITNKINEDLQIKINRATGNNATANVGSVHIDGTRNANNANIQVRSNNYGAYNQASGNNSQADVGSVNIQ